MGNFGSPTCFGNITGLAGVTVADFNADGNLDIVAIGPGIVQLFLGDGTGAFTPDPIAFFGEGGLTPNGTGVLSGPFAGNFLGGSSRGGIVIAAGLCTVPGSGYGPETDVAFPINTFYRLLTMVTAGVRPAFVGLCWRVVLGVITIPNQANADSIIISKVGNYIGNLQNEPVLVSYPLCSSTGVTDASYFIGFYKR